METAQAESATLVQVQIQLGRIEGILNTVVNEHSRRISDTEIQGRQLRTDLTAVKENAAEEDAKIREWINKLADEGRKEGNEIRRKMDERITTNFNNIAAIREDVVEVKEKQNASFGKFLMILSPIIAGAALLWNMFGDKVP